MKLVLGFAFAATICLQAVSANLNLHCTSGQTVMNDAQVPTGWITMPDNDGSVEQTCNSKMRSQVKEELNAALTYMAMGAHFAKDAINRPGFSDMFLKSASEEREHAIKFMEYMSMRGGMLSDLSNIIGKIRPSKQEWENGAEALRDALNLEASVTAQIKGIIENCEKNSLGNDYHAVDVLTGDFLTEQYAGQRDLAGKLSTLVKLEHHQGSLGEFIFDKKLLSGEV